MSPRITSVHWKVLECIFIFNLAGFVFDRQVGDHRSYVRRGTLRPVVIPTYREVDDDIIHANMRTAGMIRDQYFAFLAECK